MYRRFIEANQGYTFIELLIAITILGLMIPPLLALFSGSFRIINNAANLTIAANLCRERQEELQAIGYEALTEIVNANTMAQLFIDDGEVERYPGFHRKVLLTPYPEITSGIPPHLLPDSEKLPLLMFEVTVSWTAHNREYSKTIAGLIGQW